MKEQGNAMDIENEHDVQAKKTSCLAEFMTDAVRQATTNRAWGNKRKIPAQGKESRFNRSDGRS